MQSKKDVLREELEKINADILVYKEKVNEIRRENEWLIDEIGTTKRDSQQYISYLVDNTSKKQTTISKLTEMSKEQIEAIEKEKRRIEEHYGKIKEDIKQSILEMESSLLKKTKELEKLQDYKVRQREQEQRIRDLKQSIKDTKISHHTQMEEQKIKFLEEKLTFQKNAESRIASMQKQAFQEAMHCLEQENFRVKSENTAQRQELIEVMKRTKSLQAFRERLMEQNRVLKQDREFTQKLNALRFGEPINNEGDKDGSINDSESDFGSLV